MPEEKEDISNQRRFKRLTILTLRYRVISGWDRKKASKMVLGVVKNISENGLCLNTNTLEIDDLHIAYNDTPLVRNRLKIELDIPDLPETIKMEAEVEWYEKEPRREFYSVGASFSKIGEKDKKMLKKFIEKVGKYT